MSTTEQRMAEYEEALKKAQSYDPNAFQNQFQKDYGEATKYNQDLINQQSTALGQLQSVAPTLRQKYANSLITNPTDQMALIAQARQAPLMDYSNAVNLLSARGNKYQDILGKALGGYQTAAQQAQMDAENRWRLYQDAVQQEQFNRSLRGSGDSSSLTDWLEKYFNEDEDTTEGETYEIPEGGIAIKDGLIDLQNDSLGSSWKNRLTNEVLKQRQATGFKDVLKAYTQSQLEPLRNIKTFNDVISIPSRVVGVNTVTTADLIRRLFKK